MFELHNAARNGDVDALQKLIIAGANINDKDSLSRTPLHLAAWSGNTVSMNMISKSGLSV
jgi:ankyrin repeat protein